MGVTLYHKFDNQSFTKKNKDMKNVKKIAVAVDFSDNSHVAYLYAKSLAKQVGAKIELIHIYTLPINPDSVNGMGFIAPIDDLLETAMDQLQKFANDPNVTCRIYTGFPADKLVALSEAHQFDFLVVGNTDERGLLSKLFGSVALDISKKAHCPVLLVPHNAKFEGIKSILYAVSELSTDGDGITVTKNWAEAFNAKIHFVHVDRPDTNDYLPDITALMQDSEIDYAVKGLEFVTVRGGIDVYCEQKPIDMVVAMTRNRTFWDSIFHSSITDALAWNSPLPLLVLHKDIVEAVAA